MQHRAYILNTPTIKIPPFVLYIPYIPYLICEYILNSQLLFNLQLDHIMATKLPSSESFNIEPAKPPTDVQYAAGLAIKELGVG